MSNSNKCTAPKPLCDICQWNKECKEAEYRNVGCPGKPGRPGQHSGERNDVEQRQYDCGANSHLKNELKNTDWQSFGCRAPVAPCEICVWSVRSKESLDRGGGDVGFPGHPGWRPGKEGEREQLQYHCGNIQFKRVGLLDALFDWF